MLGAVGCVSQRQADDLQTLYRRAQEQIIELKSQLDQCNAQIRALREAPAQQDPQLLSRLEAAIAERDRLKAALEDARMALISASKTSILPAELDQELVNLADTNPELMEYDAKNGMLKFQSDLTFALGSADVSDAAKASLARLADILRKPVAQRYEARVVGHTDNVRIARAATRAAHPTNWHLSVHRAIAVKDVLEKAGVESVRLGVAGHGEYRPVAPNTRTGSRANRRVEIFLVPMTYRAPEGGVGAAPAEVEEAPAAAPAPAPAPAADFFK